MLVDIIDISRIPYNLFQDDKAWHIPMFLLWELIYTSAFPHHSLFLIGLT